MKKILSAILLLFFPIFAFGSDPFSIIYPNIKQDLNETLGADKLVAGKMGPVAARAPLDIHPPPGGIEGLYPVYGNIPCCHDTLEFRWRGKDIAGQRPALILLEKGKQQKVFSLKNKTKMVSFGVGELGLEQGKEYQWYLGRLEDGKLIAQSRVFWFRVLSKEEAENLNKDLENSKKKFFKAQVYYNYQMYHDMVGVLESLQKRYKAKEIKQLLFLGYVRLGRHAEAKKYHPTTCSSAQRANCLWQ